MRGCHRPQLQNDHQDATPKKKAKAAARGAMRAIGKTATKFAAKGKISAACAQGIADTVQRLVDAIAAV